MAWTFRVLALAGIAALLIAPLGVQVRSARAADPAPPDAAATVGVQPDPPTEQVVTIYVPAESAPEAPPPVEKPPVEPPPPPPPVEPPPAPQVTSPLVEPEPFESARGGESAQVAEAESRGGPSFVVAVTRAREPAAGAPLAGPASAVRPIATSDSPRWLLAALALTTFASSLLATRIVRRRRLLRAGPGPFAGDPADT